MLGRVNRAFAPRVDVGRLRHLADAGRPRAPGPSTSATRCARRCSTGRAPPTSSRASTRWGSSSSAAARAPGSSPASCRRRSGCCRPSCARGSASPSRCGPRTWTGSAPPTSRSASRPSCARFFEDVPERLAEATLVISRAGASSIADITVIGRPAILIPYAAAMDDHQAANAQGLVAAGGAFMIREDELTAEGLAGTITAILSDPEGASAMAQASRGAGRPDADRASGGAGRGPGRERTTGMNGQTRLPHDIGAIHFTGIGGIGMSRHRRGAAEPRLHRAGLGPEGEPDHRAARGQGARRSSSARRPRTSRARRSW